MNPGHIENHVLWLVERDKPVDFHGNKWFSSLSEVFKSAHQIGAKVALECESMRANLKSHLNEIEDKYLKTLPMEKQKMLVSDYSQLKMMDLVKITSQSPNLCQNACNGVTDKWTFWVRMGSCSTKNHFQLSWTVCLLVFYQESEWVRLFSRDISPGWSNFCSDPHRVRSFIPILALQCHFLSGRVTKVTSNDVSKTGTRMSNNA